MHEREKELSAEERDLFCAPEATDGLGDIEFEEDDLEAGEELTTQDFIEGWIMEERAYEARDKNRIERG